MVCDIVICYAISIWKICIFKYTELFRLKWRKYVWNILKLNATVHLFISRYDSFTICCSLFHFVIHNKTWQMMIYVRFVQVAQDSRCCWRTIYKMTSDFRFLLWFFFSQKVNNGIPWIMIFLFVTISAR